MQPQLNLDIEIQFISTEFPYARVEYILFMYYMHKCKIYGLKLGIYLG